MAASSSGSPPARRRDPLRESDLAADPVEQLLRWIREAAEAGSREPHAAALATVAADGAPSVRFVLVRGLKADGVAFFTHHRSRKGREIEANPRVALAFYWNETGRQVRLEGVAERLGTKDSDAYFDQRPMGSRIGAIVSPQSEVLAAGDDLHRATMELARRLRRERARVRRPEHWGGYFVRPTSLEFWQSGRSRLHDRLRYRRSDGGVWTIERLAP
jgi:pyridoxamine 5'-phosphate oxidase